MYEQTFINIVLSTPRLAPAKKLRIFKHNWNLTFELTEENFVPIPALRSKIWGWGCAVLRGGGGARTWVGYVEQPLFFFHLEAPYKMTMLLYRGRHLRGQPQGRCGLGRVWRLCKEICRTPRAAKPRESVNFLQVHRTVKKTQWRCHMTWLSRWAIVAFFIHWLVLIFA